MSQSVQIQVDPRVAALVEHMAGELPALMESGDQWEYIISRTRDGKLYRKLQRNTEIVTHRRADPRQQIERRNG
jgi:hypothetical protein